MMMMKPGDWIDKSEIDDLEMLEAIREAVRRMGYEGSSWLGGWEAQAKDKADALVLNYQGSLVWKVLGESRPLTPSIGRQIHVSDLLGHRGCPGHPAAAILHELAEVADENPEPWREFEQLILPGGQWRTCTELDMWHWLCTEPGRLRRKPRTRQIGSFDVPLPAREAPEIGTQYWAADPTVKRYRSRLHSCATWIGNEHEYRLLYRGLIHLDPKSAETHGRALASLMQEKEEENDG